MRPILAVLALGSVVAAQSWVLNPANGHQYALTAPGAWAATRALAAASGAQLATIRSAAEESWIQQHFGATGFWAGYTDEAVEGQWVWISGETTAYTNWCPGEPNNASNEDYLQVGSCWNDADGTAQLPGLMERQGGAPPFPVVQNPANGHWYGVPAPTTSWGDGEALAVTFGGHLATVRSAAEQAWIQANFATDLGTHGLWIGFNDIAAEGTWGWSSGEPVTYTNWAPGQPDNGSSIPENGGQLFGSIAGAAQWQWNDETETFNNILRPLIELPAGALAGPYQAFGAGCAGPNGVVPSLAGVPGYGPRLGNPSTVRVDGLPLALTIPLFFFGSSDTLQPGAPSYPLPADLSPLGWNGCQQLVSAEVRFVEITDTGNFELTFQVPSSQLILGRDLYGQVLTLYFPTGVAVSNGVHGVFGY